MVCLNVRYFIVSKSDEMQNLEVKKLTTEKKDALAAQYAAEATLRRVYANQKEDDSLPIESVIAPLEAEIKMYKNEVGDEIYKEIAFRNQCKIPTLLIAHNAYIFPSLLAFSDCSNAGG